jgi:hypothetical protein
MPIISRAVCSSDTRIENVRIVARNVLNLILNFVIFFLWAAEGCNK